MTRFASWGMPVAADVVTGFGGPLVGVLTALEWAATHAPEITDVVSVPADGPFLPRDLVRRLVEARAGAGAVLAQAASNGRPNPVVGLWPVALAAELRHAVVVEGIAKVDAWTARYKLATVDFEAAQLDPSSTPTRKRIWPKLSGYWGSCQIAREPETGRPPELSLVGSIRAYLAGAEQQMQCLSAVQRMSRSGPSERPSAIARFAAARAVGSSMNARQAC